MRRLGAWGRRLLLATLLGVAGAAGAAPRVPATDDTVVERLPAGAAERGLRALRAAHLRQPTDRAVALQYARRLVEQARLTGAPRQLGQAEAVLRPWWQDDTPDTFRLRIVILQARHEFDAAERDLDRLLARHPQDAEALLIATTLHQVRGRLAEARVACERLGATNRAPLPALACRAELRSLTGDGPAARADLQAALQADEGRSPPALRAWVHGLLAGMAERIGLHADADVHHREALRLEPGVPTLSAYTDFLLDRGRPGEAIELLDATQRRLSDLSPERWPDALLMRRLLALRAADRPLPQAEREVLRARMAAARLRGDATHGREEARVALALDGDARTALRAATENWTLQREPADARVLLEAARAAGEPEAARPVLLFLRQTGLQDTRLDALTGRNRGKAS